MTTSSPLPCSSLGHRRPTPSRTLPLLSLLALAGLPLAAASADPTPPTEKVAAKPAAAQPAAKPATSAAPAKAAAPATAATTTERCEVEFTGQVSGAGKLPAGSNTWVFAADGDCLAKDAHILGAMRASDQGSFAIEVFSKWGADLTLCAAVAQTPESPAKLYGKVARKFHAAAKGEIMFEKVQIGMRSGPAHTFPKANGSY